MECRIGDGAVGSTTARRDSRAWSNGRVGSADLRGYLSRMRTLTPLLLIATLATAVAMSMGTPYDLMAQNIDINQTPAAEVLKTAQISEVMQAAMDRPDLPAGMILTIDGQRALGDRRS